MFSVQEKRAISESIQKILRETNHPELPDGEIQFLIKVAGSESWSYAYIENNGAVTDPGVNPLNKIHEKGTSATAYKGKWNEQQGQGITDG